MKLLIVTSLKEHQKAVATILQEAGVAVFSVTETTGFKNQPDADLLGNWFARERDQYDSVLLFSFTDDPSTDKTLTLIAAYNTSHNLGFPIRAFVLPVEKASYSI